MVFVVGLDQVLEDRAGFPEGDVGIWIVDGGDTTVRVGGDVWFRFDVGEFDEFFCVGEVEFFEDHDYAPGVWAGGMGVELDGFEI